MPQGSVTEDLHNKVSNNDTGLVGSSIITICKSIPEDQTECQSSAEAHVRICDCLRLSMASSKIMLPGTLPKLNGHFENMRDRVLNYVDNVQNHKKGQENVGSNECFAANDDEYDECCKGENERNGSENEYRTQGDRTSSRHVSNRTALGSW